MKEKTIKVLIVEPMKAPYAAEIPEGLESLQEVVGGYIEPIYAFDDTAVILCNEEGKLRNLQMNRSLRNENGEIVEIVFGTFMVINTDYENFCSLTDEQVEKYKKYFQKIELFFIGGNKHEQ